MLGNFLKNDFHYHLEAAKELTSSIQYYEEKSIGLGAEFLDETEKAIAQAIAHSQYGPLLTKQDRRILLDLFPIKLIMKFHKIQSLLML